MSQQNISCPLVLALKHHIHHQPESFHVPGHKNGTIVPLGLEAFQHIFPYDLTEIEGLDDLHHPTGPIKEAQKLTADLYQAGESFFLVGGSTVGNLAMVHALCQPGDVVLVQRNSHKSILHAVELAGVKAVYIDSEMDQRTGISIGLTEQSLYTALSHHPEATALILTYPNYYGVCLPPDRLIQTAQEHGLKVLVDEAHGAHFVLGEPFPTSTLSIGADAVVQSAHKTLPALTMGSYLHLHSNVSENDRQMVKRSLSIFQSSSPSYLIMASLDAARGYLQSYTKEKLAETLLSIQSFKEGLQQIEQVEVVEWQSAGYQSDPLKVTIRSACSLNGFELSELLHASGIDVEMADENHILLVLGLAPLTKTSYWLNKLTCLLRDVEPEEENTKRNQTHQNVLGPIEHKGHIHIDKTERIAFWESEGRLAAEEVTPYPPGIPIIYPGQRIQEELLQQIYQLNQAGARFQGKDVVHHGIRVMKELEDKA